MVEPKYIELMQKEIDGSISYIEKTRLAKFLKSNEEARELRDQLRRIHDCLVETPLVDPPESLRPNIMRQIVPRFRSAAAHEHPGLWGRLVERFRLQPAMPFAVGVALGVLALVPLIASRQAGEIDASRMIGTLLNAASEAEVIDSRDVNIGSMHGRLRTMALDGWVLVDVAIESPDQISLVMSFDPNDIAFYGLTNLERGATFLESAPTELRLTHSGVRHYHLAFADNPNRTAEIAFRLESGGVSFQDVLHTGEMVR